MFGIVLWSAAEEGSAVVWCEDQGDLAYLPAGGAWSHVTGQREQLSSGDLVQFDLTLDGNMRVASNPRLMAQRHSPCLAERLHEAGQGVRARNRRDERESRARLSVPAEGAVVVPFPRVA